MNKIDEWDKMMTKYNNYYDGQMGRDEEDGLYVNKRFGWARFETDDMTDDQIAALSGECVTVVEGYTMASNT